MDRQNGTNSYYFNTVYLGGTSTSGGQHSIAMLCGGYSDIKNIRNNLFINARSNSGSANGTHYAVFLDYLNAKTIEYNDYYASGTGGKLGYLGPTQYNTLSAWQTATGQDQHSISTDPAFTPSNPGTAAANYATTATLPGVTISGITTDYFGTARGATPKMGAYDGSACTAPAIGSQSTATQTQCYNGTFTVITVTATGDGLTYQWYSNGSASASGGTSLATANGAQTNSYMPQSATAGTLYYYCIVTGTCGTATSTVSGAFIVIPASVGGTAKW